MTKMYKSFKKDDGSYSAIGFLRQTWVQCKPSKYWKEFRKRMPHASVFRGLALMADSYFCLVRYGAIHVDYFEYEFWKKRACERKQYVTMSMNKAIKRLFNREPIGIFRNKLLFNQKFAKFRNLLVFDFDSGSREKFHDFVSACHGKIIAKPLTGASGVDIFMPDVSDEEKEEACWKKLKASGDFFCEEAFQQDGILHEMNPTSVNTVRIYTLNDGGEIAIPFTGVRFGGSTAVVDNIHANGMCCEVDSKSGVVVGRGYNLSGTRFLYHPISNRLIVGVQIPRWQEVIAKVKEAALLYPNQGHVAWDIAVSESKVCIIEGNDAGNFNLPQIASQRGFRPFYEAAVRRKRIAMRQAAGGKTR